MLPGNSSDGNNVLAHETACMPITYENKFSMASGLSLSYVSYKSGNVMIMNASILISVVVIFAN